MNKQEAIDFLKNYSRIDSDRVVGELAEEEIVFRQYLLHATEEDLSELMDDYGVILMSMKWSEDIDDELSELMEILIEKRLDLIDSEKKVLPPEIWNSVDRKVRPTYLIYGLVAAILALVITIGLLFLVGNRSQPSASFVGEVGNDIAPGRNRATLKLDDGSIIQLDSSGNKIIQSGEMGIAQQINGLLQYKDSRIIGYNKLSTPKGGQFQIALPDGSKVWLNSASSLYYPTAFNGRKRIVELVGQAYFEIAPNAKQPFTVMMQDIEVQVLGTNFDIMSYKNENSLNITLLSGSVRIVGTDEVLLLKPGDQAVVDKAKKAIIIPADIAKAVAWKSGFFEFQNTDLTAIMRQIERWYDVEVVYQVADRSVSFGGRISKNLPLSSVLRLLEGDGVSFKIEGRKIIVM